MEIPSYLRFISPSLHEHLVTRSKPVPGVEHLAQIGDSGGLETRDALQFLCQLYETLRPRLESILKKREADRHFFDSHTQICRAFNETLKLDYLDPNYETVLGHHDSTGEIVVGPKNPHYFEPNQGNPIAPLPDFLKGPHVTLFGPPEDPKLSINAMNSFHRKIPGEPPLIAELVHSQSHSPFWGADDEDSKTPLRADLIKAGENLNGCFEGTLTYLDPNNKKTYQLEKEHLALPIKRFPGLALPSLFLFYKGNSIPLHLYDFALHLFRHWNNPKALSYYVPKLETVEEAKYIHFMVEQAERLIQSINPTYKIGSIRLFIVLENPRAIFRAHEILSALYPYFAGASLGWHDYLSSTARLFKNDPNYRIPVKADPDIVIKYIKASHELLADVVGSRGGIKIGGMYGVLPIDADLKSPSFQITMKGFIKDVVTQMKRDLSGFWVAHPDFVRIGLALVEGWKRHQKGNSDDLNDLVKALLEPKHHKEILKFIHGPDIQGLDKQSPLYARSLIVADLKESDFIANNHPDEVRYNVFQALQYLTDWLSGNGCVALPSHIDGIPVRVMDDLATAERSRWEVWHEIHHGRFSVEEFLKITHEELTFIRKNLSNEKKIVQVKWDERTAKWYPIAVELMIQLMTDPNPVEFASELLLPFTIDEIRDAFDPLSLARQLAPGKFRLEPYIERFHTFFSMCGNTRFARTMAQGPVADLAQAENIIQTFSLEEIIQAASFHGDIGESKKTLDRVAAKEQALVSQESEIAKAELIQLGAEYKKKFGFKFLVSAKGKSAQEILLLLKNRLSGTVEKEIENAKLALWEITKKRMEDSSCLDLKRSFEALATKYTINGAQIAISSGENHTQCLSLDTTDDTLFEVASLSKTIASTFAIEYFSKKQISLDTSVNSLFKKTQSKFRLKSDRVTITHLLEHTALNLHYVNGYPVNGPMPPVEDLLHSIEVLSEGKEFHYSGGGFLVLEHLLESLEKKNILEMTEPFFRELKVSHLTFNPKNSPGFKYALDKERKMFPSFAAGAMGTAESMLHFLKHLSRAYRHLQGSGPISHDTAVRMLHGKDKGSIAFMGAKMGLGVFTAEAGSNRLMIHQGANDGFRCLYVYCYEGPDRDKGFVILCGGDLNGVQFVVEVAQVLFKQMQFSGINFSNFKNQFNASTLPQEQVVNLGYKALLFSAFVPDLPEAIERRGALDPLSKFNLCVGARIVSCTNQLFARAENCLSEYLPTFDPKLYGKQGKIMDSWESVRHNPLDEDSLVIELKRRSTIHFATFSTQYHLGNQTPFVRLEARNSETEVWKELVPKTPLEGHAFKSVATKDSKTKYQYVRISMIPDGGLTRVGLFDASLPLEYQNKDFVFPDPIPQPQKPLAPNYRAKPEQIAANWKRVKPGEEINVACSAFGGKILSASNEHYSPAVQILSPFAPLDMFDGSESSRSRVPDHSENITVELGRPSILHRIEIDFTYFRNNNPKELSLEAFTEKGWEPLVERTGVKAFAGNKIEFKVSNPSKIFQLKIHVYPDGGFNRLKAFTRI